RWVLPSRLEDCESYHLHHKRFPNKYLFNAKTYIYVIILLLLLLLFLLFFFCKCMTNKAF
ncbi:MAG: hypothetical protein N7Q72_02190, partial [Spiroplasma sp. Tabriz.8]|nr:hypothetical protein [Spiroplasma sp. Tabriz.8]